ncbi:hypothetical protein FRC06_006162 [Ceratobasidium sp. 370]|nr:hypothetical protein FRC06_006162 [Ceratobasidium sp. 370]
MAGISYSYKDLERGTPEVGTVKPEVKVEKSEVKTVKIERDMQAVTVEGVVSTFIAGVEAQCLSVTANVNPHDRVVQAINALLLIGLFLSSFGAVTSLLAARWFDLLRGDEVKLLDHRWECARAEASGVAPEAINQDMKSLHEKFEYTHEGALPSEEIRRQIESCKRDKRNQVIAKAMFVPFNLIALGFFSFIAGMLLYTWKFQSYPAAIACTVITTIYNL